MPSAHHHGPKPHSPNCATALPSSIATHSIVFIIVSSQPLPGGGEAPNGGSREIAGSQVKSSFQFIAALDNSQNHRGFQGHGRTGKHTELSSVVYRRFVREPSPWPPLDRVLYYTTIPYSNSTSSTRVDPSCSLAGLAGWGGRTGSLEYQCTLVLAVCTIPTSTSNWPTRLGPITYKNSREGLQPCTS